MSITGVPSMASSPLTFSTLPWRWSNLTVALPIGFGRRGERVAKSPISGSPLSPQGWTLVAGGVVQNARDLANNPQLGSRGFFIELDHPESGETESDASPIRLSDTPARYRRAAPLWGQDNDYVYRKLLGLTNAEISRLRKNRVI